MMAPRNRITLLLLVALAVAAGGPPGLQAAEAATPPPARPSRDEFRARWKALSPEEKQAWLKQRREQANAAAAADLTPGVWPEEFKNLSPAERRAKLRELREQRLQSQRAAEDPARVAQERRARLKAKLEELKKGQSAGTLAPEAQRQLRQLEAAVKRFAGRPLPTANKAQPPAANPAGNK